MIDELFKLLTTFTEESQKAVLARVAELGFNPNAGVVPLEESYINLSSCRDILLDSIEKRKLVQLPITVQQTLHRNLTEIQRSQTSLLSGTDEVANLATAIEQLNTSLWVYGLHNLSSEVLGYQTKLNQLKNQELQAKKLQFELEKGLGIKSSIESLLADSKAAIALVQEHQQQAAEVSQKVNDLGQQALTNEQSIRTALTNAEQLSTTTIASIEQKTNSAIENIQKTDNSAAQLLASTKTANAEVIVAQQKISEFFAEIGTNRQKMVSVIEQAENAITDNGQRTNSVIEENQRRTEELIGKLQDLESQIHEQIKRATGYSLFHSFQTRQEALKKSVAFWGRILGTMVGLSLLLTSYLIYELRSAPVNGLFFLKLSLSVPIFYAIGFCTVQYARERRLEEEYAFKANISISLDPYQELVKKVVDIGNPTEREKYTAFIIDSINNVFTSPTDKIFDSHEKGGSVSNKALKQSAEIVGAFVREVKH